MSTETIKGTFYKAFGLKILSEIPLPELLNWGKRDQNETIDILIKLDNNFLKLWNNYSNEERKIVVSNNLVMFEVPETAVFCIENGVNILVSPMNGSDFDKIRLYILGTCMGVLLMQRKIIPLHGSAVVIDKKAYAIIGKSGMGKSTLATAFLSKGYQLLSDDVIAVSFGEGDVPYVMPSYPQQKLWKESMNEFGMETDKYRPLFERETKFSVPVVSNFYSHPLQLAGLFQLMKADNNKINIRKIEGLERIRIVLNQTFRGSLLNQLDLSEWHFKTSLKLIEKVPVFELQRPFTGFTAPELLTMILSQIKSEVNSR
ncbi:aldolase [Neobacillus sp. 179-C4.2 HS]|uniref:Aldolase n=1 Tax=Neobacillus driksii TaxID=3035913 RepID=A0ABV4Z1F5_9BACI|nr:aldolase [Neobacillus sp. 179.-C4.2 HS]MDP5195999.1 aldolase [Neobacillus sp. 179.-C4.2 HS]